MSQGQKGKFHVISRGEQADDIDELFEDVYKRLITVLTSKGDIITYDGSNVVRLPVGSNGQVLTARSSATPGLAWEDRATTTTPSAGYGDMRFWFAGLPYGAL